METSTEQETFVSGGPNEAGAVVFAVLAAIASPLAFVGAVFLSSRVLLTVGLIAAVAFFFLVFVIRRTAREVSIDANEITFRRVSGFPKSFPKTDVYVETRVSNYGRDALFCVKNSWVTFRFPMGFTSSTRSGEALTLESLQSHGLEIR